MIRICSGYIEQENEHQSGLMLLLHSVKRVSNKVSDRPSGTYTGNASGEKSVLF